MKEILLITIGLITQSIHAQNLVPNPSFEDENICEYHQACSPSAWFYVTKNLNAGYFINEIPAYTGKHWLSIVAGNRTNTGGRQYWQTMLLSPLIKGQHYNVSITIHGWDTGPNINDIGMYFPSQMVFYNSDTLIQPDSYLNFKDAKSIELKKGWFRLEKEYVADNDNQFMVLGNFSSENYQEIAKKRISKSIYLGLLVDDINISPVTKIACENCQHIKDSLYRIINRHSAVDNVVENKNPVTEKIIEQSPDTLVISDVYFAFSSYKISNPNIFDRYSSSFNNPTINKIKIVGYTDDIGSSDANKKLSYQRAQEVGKLLTDKFHVDASLIESEGRGISTDSPDKNKNRRVEIYIYRQ